MNERLDELTLRLADGLATPDEDRELEAMLAADERARRDHGDLLDVDRMLRRGRPPVGTVDRVMARVRTMTDVPRLPARRRPVLRIWGAVGLLAAAALLLFVGWRGRRPALQAGGEARAPESPLVELVGRRGTVNVRDANRIETAADGAATLRYRRDSRLEIGAGTSLSAVEGASGDILRLAHGSLTAFIARQPADRPLQIVTAEARIEVLAAVLRVAAAGRATSIAVTEGRASIERLSGGGRREVAAGQQALVTADERGGPAAAKPEAPEPAVVFSFDFEDGALPRRFPQGHVVSEGCPPGSSHCVLGTLEAKSSPNAPIFDSAIGVEGYKPPLFHYAPGMVLEFDYWAGVAVREIFVRAYDIDGVDNHKLYRGLRRTGTWAHARIRLRDLQPSDAKNQRRLIEGDAIGNLYVLAAGQPLYVDNLRLLEYAPDQLPESTSIDTE
jgi:ferric-dicitrate binding protein FerR (iron transport regulator)